MKAAIVTGANGFIGKVLCEILIEQKVHTYAIVRKKEAMDDIQCSYLTVIELDMEHYQRLPQIIKEEIDVFYHLAWEGASGAILADYSQQIKNIQYTCDTIEIASKMNCRKFIMAGTINELELMQLFEAEENPPRPACIYGISKLACDMMCKTIAAKNEMNFNVAIIGSCFGPGDTSKRIHNVFISHMLKGIRPKLVEANNMHDWIYVDDVAKMFFAIGEKSVNMKNYYLGHNQLRVFREILEEVRDILNPQMELVFGEIKTPFFIDYDLVNLNSVYEDTGYQCESDFKDNILKTAQWVKEQGL